ncbi:metallophosphoesterase [Sphingosinicellaceae bacterium]|nr:metallophosphoesterase [Sphingosinicellaceae bacterium]
MKLLRILATVLMLVAGLVLALVVYGYYEATRDPVVAHYSVGFAKWPAGAPPLRVVQLTDIHVAWPDMPLSRVARIVDQVNALHPDLVVITGDFVGGKLWDRQVANFDEALVPLVKLCARYGVIAVRGNHDSPYWTPIVFARTPIRMLQNRWISVGPITVAGVDDPTSLHNPVTDARLAVAGAPTDRPLVLLSHVPDFFQWIPRSVDLLICGHTHGGQIVLPLLGTRSTGGVFNDHHLRGLFSEHGQRMIVSSGLGTSMVPLRIGVPPEVAMITLGPQR